MSRVLPRLPAPAPTSGSVAKQQAVWVRQLQEDWKFRELQEESLWQSRFFVLFMCF